MLLESIANTDTDTSLEKYSLYFNQYLFLESIANSFTDTSANIITLYIN